MGLIAALNNVTGFKASDLESIATVSEFSLFDRKRLSKLTRQELRGVSLDYIELSLTQERIYVYFSVDGKRMSVSGDRKWNTARNLAQMLFTQVSVTALTATGIEARTARTLGFSKMTATRQIADEAAVELLTNELMHSNVNVIMRKAELQVGATTFVWH